MNLTSLIAAAVFALLCSTLAAGPLREARVSRMAGEVTVVAVQGTPRPAVLAEDLAPHAALRTGAGARAEVRFGDGTLARLGGGTDLKLPRGTRELMLEQGTLLVEVPAWRGGTRVRAGTLTIFCGAATILLEHLPDQSLKLVVLAGDARIAGPGFFGDSLVISPGKMLITKPDAHRIPEPVDVDLDTLVRTSALVDPGAHFPGAPPLASRPRIAREIARQAASFKAKRLIPTNLAIVGSGTSVTIPGAPGAARATDTVTAGNSVTLGVGNEDEDRKSAEVALARRGGMAADRENSLPEP